MRSQYKKHSDYGPGGRNCPCCGPGPSERRRFDRTVKRIERRIAQKEMRTEVSEFMTSGRDIL